MKMKKERAVFKMVAIKEHAYEKLRLLAFKRRKRLGGQLEELIEQEMDKES